MAQNIIYQRENDLSFQYWRDEFTGTSLSSDWIVTPTGSWNGTVSVSGGSLSITSGTQSLSSIVVQRQVNLRTDSRILINFICSLSTRQNGQEVFVELVDVSNNSFIQWKYTGTVNTNAHVDTAVNGVSGGNNLLNIPATNNLHFNQIDIRESGVKFSSTNLNTVASKSDHITRTRNIPEPKSFGNMMLRIRIVNTATVSNCTFTLDSISLRELPIISTEFNGLGDIKGSDTLPVNLVVVPNLNIQASSYGSTDINPAVPILANTISTTSSKDFIARAKLSFVCISDQNGILLGDCSTDNSNFVNYLSYNITANTPTTDIIIPPTRYFRFRYNNNNPASSAVRLLSSLYSV